MPQVEKRKFAKPTVYDQLYPGRFIKAAELLGRKVTVSISDYEMEELEGDDGKKVKAILHFKETEKALVMCKTNGMCIRDMFGKTLTNWVGKRVTLFEDTWNGEPCIRIWGSPDIERDFDVEVALPRRRPFKKTMHRVVIGGPKGVNTSSPGTGKQEPDAAASINTAKIAETLESLSSSRESVWGVYAAAGKEVPVEVEGAFDDRKASLEQAEDEEVPL